MEKDLRLTSDQELRLQCLILANQYACSTNGEICEHEQQRIADEYFAYIITGKRSVHDEDLHTHKTFDA